MKVTFVVGPTASGKSELALQLAERHDGVIVNCDSVQAYSHVQIGAAKPTEDELARRPHYLYGHIHPPNEYTAGDYARDVHALLPQLEKSGIPHVYIVGGTGFYFQAIEKGMYEAAKVPDDLASELREQAGTREGLHALYEELKLNDPESIEVIHANDQYRIVRAIEILRSTGKKPSVLKREMAAARKEFPYPLEKIGVNWERSELHLRIHQRVKKMLAMGLVEEVRNLKKLGFEHWAPMASVGYKETLAYLKGELSGLDNLEESILISTRQLAKRQITWFKRDSSIVWFDSVSKIV